MAFAAAFTLYGAIVNKKNELEAAKAAAKAEQVSEKDAYAFAEGTNPELVSQQEFALREAKRQMESGDFSDFDEFMSITSATEAPTDFNR